MSRCNVFTCEFMNMNFFAWLPAMSFLQSFQMSTPAILKNTPHVNKLLTEVKHLVRIVPLSFPHGMPDDESDFDHLCLKPTGEMIVKRKLPEYEPTDSDAETGNEWKLSVDTLLKHLDRIKWNRDIHREYHRTNYSYKYNQDGKEYRYQPKDNPPHQY